MNLIIVIIVILIGIWTHLAVVYNGGLGKVKIFVDSVKIFTSTKKIVKQAHVPWSATVTVGKFPGKDAEFFSGVMDEFYIFTTPLWHTEVEALMSKCEFPSDSKYICSYNLAPLACSMFQARSINSFCFIS